MLLDIEGITKIWEACALDDTRPVLAGVHIEPLDGGQVRATAADGFMVATITIPAEFHREDPLGFQPFIVPAIAFKTGATKTMKYWRKLEIETDADDPRSGRVSVRLKDGSTASWDLIVGVFPNYRRLFKPDDYKEPHEVIGIAFDPVLYQRLSSAITYGRMVALRPGPTASAPFLAVGGEGYGLLMPMSFRWDTVVPENVDRGIDTAKERQLREKLEAARQDNGIFAEKLSTIEAERDESERSLRQAAKAALDEVEWLKAKVAELEGAQVEKAA